MTVGTSSLRCPYCGQEFLSLQQRTDSPETCPHCAYSSLLASFISTTPAPTTPAPTTAAAQGIPLLRRIVHNQAVPAPPPAPASPSYHPGPFANANHNAHAAQPSPFQAVAPPARSSPFQQVAPPPSFPSALEALFQQKPAPAAPPRTFASPPPPAEFRLPEIPDLTPPKPASPLFPPAPEKPIIAATPATTTRRSASWSGSQQTPPPVGQDLPQATPLLPVQSQVPNSQITDGSAIQQPDLGDAPFRDISSSRATPSSQQDSPQGLGASGFFAALMFSMILGFGSWVFLHDQVDLWTLHFPAAALSETVTESPRETTSLAPVDPQDEEVRRATPSIDNQGKDAADSSDSATNLRSAAVAVPELVRRLFEADTPEERAACIVDPDRYADQVESFFAATNGTSRPGFTGLQQFSAVPLSLPGGEPTVLFQITTDANPEGALLRPIRGADGSHRIHWPLFHETHDRHLLAYLDSQEGEPRWFHVGLRPSHGFDLPAELREEYLIYDLQGSADTSVRLVAYAEKETSLARFLKQHVEWGEIYLARLLLRGTQLTSSLDGLTILDCEGRSSAPSTAETTGP